ncbi:MAG TPA: SUF system NifU family Fe-S cluster assembly protein [Acidocella sp.]|jgi:nitrogen fixation NifU-like protein|nr:SUF system NifU family Fe-S cluster assembly protein [Acidocella sp.]
MTDIAELYQSLIMDRSRKPRFAERLECFDAEAKGENPMCGDRIHLFLKRDGTQVRHDSHGCTIMTASADLMAEAVAHKTPTEYFVLRAAFEDMVNSGKPDPMLGNLNALSGVSEYRSRIRCAMLPWSALAQAVNQDEPKNG